MAGMQQMLMSMGGRKVVQIVITGDVQNLNPYTYRNSGGTNISTSGTYVAGFTDVEIIVNSGVYVGSASTASYAMTIDTQWAAGDKVSLTLQSGAYIIGAGGAGARHASSGFFAIEAASGGPAISISRGITLANSGIIGGGGGGGGYGADYNFNDGAFPYPSAFTHPGVCGGGGQGFIGGASQSMWNTSIWYGTSSPGTKTGAGAGAVALTWSLPSGNGGTGGTLGSSGAAGQNIYGGGILSGTLYYGTAGAAGGSAIVGVGNLIGGVNGTIYGATL